MFPLYTQIQGLPIPPFIGIKIGAWAKEKVRMKWLVVLQKLKSWLTASTI